MMFFCSLTGLMEATKDEQKLSKETNVLVTALFDHEEVGSESAQGAGSPILNELFKRLIPDSSKLEIAIRKSFLISADMAHAIHPNYSDKHEGNHKVAMNNGVVIKFNVSQRYATNSTTAFLIHELAKRNNIPVQDFVMRNDMACGTTIGPIISSHVGLRTVDIGNPQLSMHSIREMAAIADITHAVNLIKAFYEQFTELDSMFSVKFKGEFGH